MRLPEVAHVLGANVGFFSKLLGRTSPEQSRVREAELRNAARASWSAAQASGDMEAMNTATQALSEAGLNDEYTRACEHIAERFPAEASRVFNDIGVHFYFEQEYERALTFYTRSYLADEDGGSTAESNILEVCRKIAEDANTDQDEVRALMRYFKICTRQVDPEATIETIDLLSVFRPRVNSLAEETRAAAQDLLLEVEEAVAELDDVAFAASTNRELDDIAVALGLDRAAADRQQY